MSAHYKQILYPTLLALALAACQPAAGNPQPAAEAGQTPPAAAEAVPAAPINQESTMSATEMPTPIESTQPDWWHPTVGMTWQWHLSEPPVDTTVDAEVYDIDLTDNDAAVVNALHAQGRKVICYISVGSVEDWRPDAADFPAEVIGNDYDGWPGEKWLDIRRIDLLAPIMTARLDLCKAKGFDAVEPDNMQIADNDSGFDITAADEIAYAKWLAEEAHKRGLAIGIKNSPERVHDLVDLFDFAITEDCFDQGWCEEMSPFITAGKPVFAAEYTDTGVDFGAACRRAADLQFSIIQKNRILTAFRVTCSD